MDSQSSMVDLVIAEVPLIPYLSNTLRPGFDLDDPGFERAWRDRKVWPGDEHRHVFLRWTSQGEEIARAHINLDAEIGGQYVGVGELTERVHDIPFLEVRLGARLRGVGRVAVRQIEKHFPDRTLTACSEKADGFWERTGWTRYHRVDGSAHSQSLYVRPARTPGASGQEGR